jgi:hypothetical protein
MRAASSHIAISAIVYEPTGFLAAAFRGVVTGLSLLAHQAFPHRMFKDVTDAAEWIEGEPLRFGRRFQADEIERAVSVFRALIRQGS